MTSYGRYGLTSASTEFWLTSADGLNIACSRWDGNGPIRGVVQIAHGLGEHLGRYAELIKILVEEGLTVYGNDHRGHGRTAFSAKNFGDFGNGGFNLLVGDMVRLSGIAKDENPGKPFILLGHSMGSFAAQQYVLDHSRDIDGLVLSGSGALDGLARLANSSLAENNGNILNAAFEPARTPFDWLSRDSAVVDAFMDDPLCFGGLQPGSLVSFLAAARQLSNLISLGTIRQSLPIYLFSGSADPIGQQLEGLRLLIDRYQKVGITKISCDFYPDGRHEMLNEINRSQVRANLLNWISVLLGGRTSVGDC